DLAESLLSVRDAIEAPTQAPKLQIFDSFPRRTIKVELVRKNLNVEESSVLVALKRSLALNCRGESISISMADY
ncbi:hypothetical protein TorRG33x02_243770, partial [Trema orientale]